MKHKQVPDPWYQEHMKRMIDKHINDIAIMQVLMDTRDKLLRTSINLQLLIDDMIYQMKEVS